MPRQLTSLLGLLLILVVALAGCQQAAAPTPAPTKAPAAPTAAPQASASGDAALKVTGKVASPIGWAEDEVKAMNTTTAESKNKQGETSTYTGVPIKDLLALAKPASDAATVAFVADDGFTAETPLADVTSCANCIVSFRSQGGFSTVLPDKPSNLQVKGVVEIQVK